MLALSLPPKAFKFSTDKKQSTRENLYSLQRNHFADIQSRRQ